MDGLWLGIDVGTTAVKAALYQPDGTQIAHGETPSAVATDADGKSEQDMEAVWANVCVAVRKAIDGIAPEEIKSVGLAAQGDGLWALDAQKQPVGPAILWNDSRAADIVTELYTSGKAAAVSHACHTSIWPGTCGPIFRWLQDNDPDRTNPIAHVVHCAGWVGLNLTGELAVDYSDASIPFLDLGARTYAADAFKAVGCETLADKLCTPRPATTQLGPITAKASKATGLPESLPVSVGTLDLSAMIVGMGMDSPGDIMMILGTTAVVNILTDKVERSDLPVGATVLHANGETLVRVLAPTTGAAAFDWFCALHPQTLGGQSPAEIAGKLNALAAEVPPGANGVTFLPYLNGERAPFVAPKARAAFLGLSAASTKAEMGRAVMEGAAYSLRHCLQAEGAEPGHPVRFTGGGSKNALWNQIIADVVKAPIHVSAASDHGLWGAACIGAAAALECNATELARREEAITSYTPNQDVALAYDRAFERYLSLSQLNQAAWNG